MIKYSDLKSEVLQVLSALWYSSNIQVDLSCAAIWTVSPPPPPDNDYNRQSTKVCTSTV